MNKLSSLTYSSHYISDMPEEMFGAQEVIAIRESPPDEPIRLWRAGDAKVQVRRRLLSFLHAKQLW